MSFAEQLLRKTRAADLRIAELEAQVEQLTVQRDEARADAEAKAHRVGELGALLDETLARAERAEAVIAEALLVLTDPLRDTLARNASARRILDGSDQ